ncbi:MAG: triose-phosphate isomerase [Chromatiales bacterium]|jgi:triosephosphate isomerase (TIM)|nr:triose-phosphate isomerase [Chromatiales bacterium]
MRTSVVAGNWKMNGDRAFARELVAGVAAQLDEPACEVILCPPMTLLDTVRDGLAGCAIALGAQTVSEHASGAYTGEISVAMLADAGCTHVIVGHSERRALYGETDAAVVDKFVAAQSGGLIPILCVGESLEERESGATESIVGRQVKAVLDGPGVGALATAIVAYEPVWAIGTGKTASPEQAQEVHAHIRALVSERDAGVANGLRILYGGSVKGSNAVELFAMKDIDGGLIGGASLQADDFVAICRAGAAS